MKVLSVEETSAEVLALSEKLNVMLSDVAKLNVIKDLTVVAAADGTVDEAELEALYTIAAGLYVRPEFIDHVLSGTAEDDQ